MAGAQPFRTNQEAMEAFRRYSMQNYDPAPVAFSRGQGARLWDVEGRSYIDFAAGVAVCSLGHAHPAWARAVAEQAARLAHTSNLYLVPNQLELARELVQLSGLARAFFCNSGTEAMEAALKLARLWGNKNGGRTGLVATHRGFHGRTMGALALTGQPQYQRGYEPLMPGVTHVPYGDPGAIEAALTPATCAVVLEPIQGEGGVHVPPRDYLREVRRICDAAGVLLVLDEVQTGIGRTGTWFSYEQAGIVPDILALAKGLGGGFPIGAVLCNPRAAVFGPGNHGSTFGGSPLATAAALATLRTLKEENVLENVRRQASALSEHLAKLQELGFVSAARGTGLLLGFDLPSAGAKAFQRSLIGRGLLTTNVGDATIRLCPPLTLTDEEMAEGADVLERSIRAASPVAARA